MEFLALFTISFFGIYFFLKGGFMEVLFLLCLACGGVWLASRESGTGNHSGNQNQNQSGFYRHIDGRVFRYVGLMQNQSETLYIIEITGNRKVVDAVFFQNCFAISEQEYFAISDFERNRKRAVQDIRPEPSQAYPPPRQEPTPPQQPYRPFRPEPPAYRPEPSSYPARGNYERY